MTTGEKKEGVFHKRHKREIKDNKDDASEKYEEKETSENHEESESVTKKDGCECEDDKESEYENTEDNNSTKRDDSIEIPIEDYADDAPDGKRKQSNTYAAKKTVAQGMMDIALITANANQLRYLIEFNRHSSTFFVNLFLIILSLLLQICVGVSLIFKGRLDLRGQSKHSHAKKINNYVVVAVFLVTIINVFIAGFTVTGSGNANSVAGNVINIESKDNNAADLIKN